MMDTSRFSDRQSRFEAVEQMETQGATCDTFRVKLYGKLHFLKRLKAEYAGDIRYHEALRKEFETGYRLEHPNLVRYISLDSDSILMEYVEGEPLSQRLVTQPDYFTKRKNTDKFIRQLLDVVGYLHSHQVLHLDLKPDNILLTRINDDVKLIDLGCCYTDFFPDTTGHTNAFAAPEQLSGGVVGIPTDVFAIGKILECLPAHTLYNKVIARCTAEDPSARYQSVEEILHDVSHGRRYWRVVAILAALVAAIVIGVALFSHQPESVPALPRDILTPESIGNPVQQIPVPENRLTPENQEPVPVNHDPIVPVIPAQPKETQASAPVTTPTPISQSSEKENLGPFDEELERMMDKAYRSTIATFCDSVFPSLTVGRQWSKQSSEFHAQVLQAAADLSRKYPDIPESVVIEHVESRFQSLVGYVFNRMRQNGQQQKSPE
ncbi:MAG: protein kinase [Prevotella sp.]|nr:protein kinase [Prevotella sp.]